MNLKRQLKARLRKNQNKLIEAIIILVLSFSTLASAETVTLKSGKQIQGKITEKTDQYIKIESEGTPLYYERKFIKSIEEDKTSEDANFYLKAGLKYGSEAKFKEAEQEFKKGLEINPSDHNLGESLRLIDDLKNGRIKEDYTLYLFKGSNELMNKQYKEAIPEFKEALKLYPADSDLYYYLGVCNYYLEQYQEAIDYLQKAQKAKPNDDVYYYLGITHYSLGQYPEALNYLNKLLEINPNDAEAYSIIGTCNYLMGNLGLAKENLSKAKELFKKQGDYLKASDLEEFLGK